MNADNRETRSPFSGVTPAGNPAPSSQQAGGTFQPATGQQAHGQQPGAPSPTSGQQPTRRPLSGQQPKGTAQPSGSTPQRTSVRSAVSGQQTTAAPSAAGAASRPFATTGGTVFTPASSTATATGTAATSADVDPDAPRRAKVMVSRIDPLSAVKIGFLLSVAAGVMLVVAVYVLWAVLNGMGTFSLANEWVSKLFTEDQELNLMQFFHQGRVMSATILIAVVNVFILTAMSAVWAFLYNIVSSVVGGVFVTLSDE